MKKKKGNFTTLLLILVLLAGLSLLLYPSSAITGTPSTKPAPLPRMPKKSQI